MGGFWGRHLRLSIFGESHGPAIGMVVDGLPPGLKIDETEIAFEMSRRAPGNDVAATPRKEKDQVKIISGVYNGYSTGAPICGMIENDNTRSGDYETMRTLARPGHADFTGYKRFSGYNDHRGGGHFSGRLTAPLVFAGSLAKLFLREQGVVVGAHIASIGFEKDMRFDPVDIAEDQLNSLRLMKFPLLDVQKEAAMRAVIDAARRDSDSIGGTIECAAVGLPAGWGSPFFDSIESSAAHLLFSVPAVKGIEFGAGFGIDQMLGSQANDAFVAKDGIIRTTTNHNGGLNGGITNGMPVILRASFKPTPSIAKTQNTINFVDNENVSISVRGRHDPCVVLRAVPVVEAALAVVLCDAALE